MLQRPLLERCAGIDRKVDCALGREGIGPPHGLGRNVQLPTRLSQAKAARLQDLSPLFISRQPRITARNPMPNQPPVPKMFPPPFMGHPPRSEEHTSELQSPM